MLAKFDIFSLKLLLPTITFSYWLKKLNTKLVWNNSNISLTLSLKKMPFYHHSSLIIIWLHPIKSINQKTGLWFLPVWDGVWVQTLLGRKSFQRGFRATILPIAQIIAFLASSYSVLWHPIRFFILSKYKLASFKIQEYRPLITQQGRY